MTTITQDHRESATARRSILTGLFATAALAGGLQAQQTYDACYVPDVGAIYLINLQGLPTQCLASSHVAISWTSGGEPADGSVTAVKLADGAVITIKLADDAVTEAKLGFDPATQAELDALGAAGTLNAEGNPVDWTRLKNVPADFADGVDNTGGTPSDLVCSGCVGTTDIADAAVTATKLAADASNAIDHGTVNGLADDDHGQYLLVEGTRAGIDGFAVTGTLNSGVIPVEGAGVRLMWYPGKAAFRAGEVLGTQWDDANVGLRSTAMGVNTTASGLNSTAMGQSTTASGAASTAIGHATIATGQGATAMGRQTTASGDRSTAMGFGTTASGTVSTAMGFGTTASGFYSTAMGSATTADGSIASAMGYTTTAQAYASLVIGRFNVIAGDPTGWVSTDPLFVAGNGSGGTDRSNALTLFKNGNMDLNGHLKPGLDDAYDLGDASFRWNDVWATNGTIQTSDAALKRDVTPLRYGLAELEHLRPVTYRWIRGDERVRLGLIAQDVRDVVPELVHGSGDPSEPLGINYGELVPLLIKAIQEQQAGMDAQNAAIEALRAEVAGLRAAVERVRK